jgi:hypothetical protein
MGIDYNNIIVSDGLVFYIDAANPRCYSGTGLTANGLVGGIGGTLVNGVGFSSANNGLFSFDGTNDYASVPINLVSSNMTIELVFKINSAQSFTDIAVLDDGSNSILIELGGDNAVPNTNGHLRYYSLYADGVGSVSNTLATSSQYVLDSKIHMSALTVGSSSASAYFDGIFQANASVIENKTFTRLVLGNDLIRNNRFCNCNIYQVKIYNRALSAQEILQNYNATKGRYR